MYEQQPHQPWGAQPPGAPQGGGAIALTTKYHPLAFMLGLFKPQVEINGHPAANAWGRTVIPVPAGQHHVHVHVPYLLPPRIGSADLGVPVHPGQTVELEYRAPMIAFIGGALGAPPQKYPGMAVTIVLMVISLVILLCVCGGFILALASGGSNSALGVPGLDAAAPVIAALTTPGSA
ncbi:hypothetical protein Asp14428_76650 [Actinoplanes sp. NBRC 14428]|uniref:Uncharacterized protein n=1 Tax=Pseudosporangium ferrugineum TaxID=439699 RepID=A0A2T0RXA3_9ACTN|nr:hypothetical protein [Pseudosporangium ferrugineum]PRY25762.1 hypothetical protein CLV70_112128 [Pseudosporangium ferrugineum]BCJ56190.1 hypothetical protein Asp14428_76650 [Actinoplanes sp. NBRC 14428]